MDLADCSLRRSSSGDSVCVDPGLNLYVRPGFELQVSLGKIAAVARGRASAPSGWMIRPGQWQARQAVCWPVSWRAASMAAS